MARILIVDDERNIRRSLSIAVEEWGHSVIEAASGEEALKEMETDTIDLVITDLVMQPMDGLDLLKQIKLLSPLTEVLMMSAHGSIDKAVKAIRHGAADFITKPFPMDHLKYIVEKLIDQKGLKQTVKYLKTALADQYPFEDVVAVSSGMKEVMNQASMVADWPAPVLIQGESGVGKELVAMAIHHLSGRKNNPFIPINCGAFSETLLDSELFGHCKGAFTGAIVTKHGLLEEANGGSLLLDEIGESPAALQVRLLRFLDNGKFRRIGEVMERSSDVRIIAATNRNLSKSIKENQFREDLFYRLSVAVINVPPLRERKEDIAALSERFLKLYVKKMGKNVARIHPRVLSIFQRYPWPGNVRELENTIEHAMIVCDKDEIGVEHIAAKFLQQPPIDIAAFSEKSEPLAAVEKKYIISVLEKCEGNKKKAAEILQISRTTLISRLKQYGHY